MSLPRRFEVRWSEAEIEPVLDQARDYPWPHGWLAPGPSGHC